MVTFADRAGGAEWTGFLAGADRIAMDNHPYLIFTTPPPDYSVAYAASVVRRFFPLFGRSLIFDVTGLQLRSDVQCDSTKLWCVHGWRMESCWWGFRFDQIRFLLIRATATVNDCGHWLNNVGSGSRYDGTYRSPTSPGAPSNAAIGSCDPWNVRPSFSYSFLLALSRTSYTI